MTDPELLKLARQARNALWVIAASCAIVACLSLIGPLLALIQRFFLSGMVGVAFFCALLAAATIGVIAWAITTETAEQTSASKPE